MKKTVLYSLPAVLFFLTTLPVFSQGIIPQSAQMLIEDYFQDNRNNWDINDNYLKSVSIEDGHYHYQARQDEIQYLTIPVDIDTSRDFVIEGRLAYKSGKSGYGLVFGRKNDKNTWRFIITDRDGQFFIRNVENGKANVIQPWKYSSAIHQSFQMNTYSVEKKGRKLKFYANSKLLKETDFNGFIGDQFGFFISGLSSFSADYFKIAYTDRKGEQPKQVTTTFIQTDHETNKTSGPAIEIREPHLERGFKAVQMKMLRVAGFAKTEAGLYQVRVNGVEAYLGPEGYFSAEVPMNYGDNTITVTAIDKQHNASSKTFTVNRR